VVSVCTFPNSVVVVCNVLITSTSPNTVIVLLVDALVIVVVVVLRAAFSIKTIEGIVEWNSFDISNFLSFKCTNEFSDQIKFFSFKKSRKKKNF